MCEQLFSPLELMIRAAGSCPVPTEELRRQTLAKSIRAYHERAQRRRMLFAASLLFGFMWMAGSARQLLAQTGNELLGPGYLSQIQDAAAMHDSPATDADEWQAVERTLQSRSRRYQILKSAWGTNLDSPSTGPGSAGST